MAKTFAQLKAYARARANMENSDFIGAPEEAYVVNDAYRELYYLLIDGYENYFVNPTPVEFTLSSGSNNVLVATDLYKIVGVDRKIGSDWKSIDSFNFRNRNNVNTLGYYLLDRYLHIAPQVDATFRYWYVPDVTELSLDADEIVAECERWWKYIALTAAIEYLEDEESDTDSLMKQIEKLRKEINLYKSNRVEESCTIANVNDPIDDYDLEYYGV